MRVFQDFMPFSDIYISTFKKDIEHNTMLLQTALALQSNKFIQVAIRCDLLFLFEDFWTK